MKKEITEKGIWHTVETRIALWVLETTLSMSRLMIEPLQQTEFAFLEKLWESLTPYRKSIKLAYNGDIRDEEQSARVRKELVLALQISRNLYENAKAELPRPEYAFRKSMSLRAIAEEVDDSPVEPSIEHVALNAKAEAVREQPTKEVESSSTQVNAASCAEAVSLQALTQGCNREISSESILSLGYLVSALPSTTVSALSLVTPQKNYKQISAILGVTSYTIARAVNKAIEYAKDWIVLKEKGWNDRQCLDALLVLDHLDKGPREAIWLHWIEGMPKNKVDEALLRDTKRDIGLAVTYILRRYHFSFGEPLHPKPINPRLPSKQSPTLRRIFQYLESVSVDGKVANSPKEMAQKVFPELDFPKAYSHFWMGLNWLKENGWVTYEEILSGHHDYLVINRPINCDHFNWLDVDDEADFTPLGESVISYKLVYKRIFEYLHELDNTGRSFRVSLETLIRQAVREVYALETDSDVQGRAVAYAKRRQLLVREVGRNTRNSTYHLGLGGDRLWEQFFVEQTKGGGNE